MVDMEPLKKEIIAGSSDITIHERFIQLHFRPSFYDTSDLKKLYLNLSENIFKTQDMLPYLAPRVEPPSLLPQLESLDIPLLIIQGEIKAIPIESDRIRKVILPNAGLVNIGQSGHFPIIEKPEKLTKLIVKFINR